MRGWEEGRQQKGGGNSDPFLRGSINNSGPFCEETRWHLTKRHSGPWKSTFSMTFRKHNCTCSKQVTSRGQHKTLPCTEPAPQQCLTGVCTWAIT
ncbi:hypothetical protein CDAR_42481 [Caerostris darwini]|uniref:Uncharacterized protein n=1 Tax=Caerostris darwini TaxID=1538125 RepID=A0AAV4RK35_9ARAC|nr:hypothetical protein CDAR_42481 [Caerostris darwini]